MCKMKREERILLIYDIKKCMITRKFEHPQFAFRLFLPNFMNTLHRGPQVQISLTKVTRKNGMHFLNYISQYRGRLTEGT